MRDLFALGGIDQSLLDIVFYAHEDTFESVFKVTPEEDIPANQKTKVVALSDLLIEPVGEWFRLQSTSNQKKAGGSIAPNPRFTAGFRWKDDIAHVSEQYLKAGFKVDRDVSKVNLPLPWIKKLIWKDELLFKEALNSIPKLDNGKPDSSIGRIAAIILEKVHGGGPDAREAIFSLCSKMGNLNWIQISEFFCDVRGPVKGAINEMMMAPRTSDLPVKQVERESSERAKLTPETDVHCEFFPDGFAYLAVVDINSFNPTCKNWETLAPGTKCAENKLDRKILEDHTWGKLISFGTPEEDLRVRLTTKKYNGKKSAKFTSFLKVTGEIGVVSYDVLTQLAGESPFANFEYRVEIPPGIYNVEVVRRIDYESGAQFFPENTSSRGDHYVIVFQRAMADEDQLPNNIKWIPWTSFDQDSQG